MLTAPAQVTITAPAHLQATGVAVFLAFLVADTQLYKRLCPSVRPLVCWALRWSVMVIELKSGETSVLDTVYV